MLHLNEGIDQAGHVRFSEIGQLAGVSNTDWSWSALLADFDNDGWKDLFISNGYLRDYTNLDFLKYTEPDARLAALKRGEQNFKTLDLVSKMPSNKISNYIFHNNGDLTFSNTTADWGLSRPNRDAAAASKSSGQGLSQNESNRQFRFNALFNACCYWWGEDCGSRRPVGSLWRKR